MAVTSRSVAGHLSLTAVTCGIGGQTRTCVGGGPHPLTNGCVSAVFVFPASSFGDAPAAEQAFTHFIYALAYADPEVKKSESGVCHGQDSVHYQRTKKFTAYDSMQACLASGGRESRAARQTSPWRWLLAAASMAVRGLLGWLWMRKRGPT